MKFDRETKILIVGLGMIGASYAGALSSQGYEVGGIDINKRSVDYCLGMGWLSHGRDCADAEYIKNFDLIIFAVYPKTFIEWLKDNQQHIKKNALLTDVTGVKGCVVYDVQEMLRDDLEFIAAHPMAGRERSGAANADKDMFLGANYIVTPTDKNTQQAIESCKKLGRVLGFRRIVELSPQKHDEMIGFLSQLTHCIAVTLMTCRDCESLTEYTGDSFRDLTRIAKINDVMWSELFLLNKETLIEQMELFEKQFERLKNYISESDTYQIRKMMKESTLQRELFDIRKDD